MSIPGEQTIRLRGGPLGGRTSADPPPGAKGVAETHWGFYEDTGETDSDSMRIYAYICTAYGDPVPPASTDDEDSGAAEGEGEEPPNPLDRFKRT